MRKELSANNNLELNFFITEFAHDKPGDDIKILLKEGTEYSQDELIMMASQAFMGLYVSSGNTPQNKHGVLPGNNDHSLIVYSNIADGTVRMLCIISNKYSVNDHLRILSKEKISDAIVAIRVLMSNPSFDTVAANILFKQLDLLIKEELETQQFQDKEIKRINEIFGD